MKKRVKHVAVAQCGKMVAAIYFVISLPILALVLIPVVMGMPQVPLGIGLVILLPFVYAFFTYLAGVLTAWIYNIVAARIGGFEFTLSEVSS